MLKEKMKKQRKKIIPQKIPKILPEVKNMNFYIEMSPVKMSEDEFLLNVHICNCRMLTVEVVGG